MIVITFQVWDIKRIVKAFDGRTCAVHTEQIVTLRKDVDNHEGRLTKGGL